LDPVSYLLRVQPFEPRDYTHFTWKDLYGVAMVQERFEGKIELRCRTETEKAAPPSPIVTAPAVGMPTLPVNTVMKKSSKQSVGRMAMAGVAFAASVAAMVAVWQ